MDINEKLKIFETIEEAIFYLIRNNISDDNFYNDLYKLTSLLGDLVNLKPPSENKGIEYLMELNQWLGYVKALVDFSAPLPEYDNSKINIDIEFRKLVNFVNDNSLKSLEDYMVAQFKRIDILNRKNISNYTKKYPLWGDINYQTGKGSMVTDRANCLKEHINDFIWIYNRFCDYRSRYVLYAILKYWITYDFNLLGATKEPIFNDYFDLDLLILGENDVIADVGAFIGDTALQITQVYNKCKKVYCYEIDPNNATKVKNLSMELPFIELRQKAASNENGIIYLDLNSQDSSSSKTTKNGNLEVEAVTLDSDIKEPLSLIKMDIEGAEQMAIQGCINHIKNNRSKLAICTYHNNEDIWKIPRMIDNMRNDYNFYMRYNGGNLFPTEYVFFAL